MVYSEEMLNLINVLLLYSHFKLTPFPIFRLLALLFKIADNANEFLNMTSTFSLFQYFFINSETHWIFHLY